MDLAAHLHRIVEVDVVGGELDASSWDWRGVFEPSSDPAYFARVELDHDLGSIRWPSGADVAPETLHPWVARERDNVSA